MIRHDRAFMLRPLAACLLLLAFLAFPALSQTGSGGAPFNHATTGFSLDGAHARERCESCHIQGMFRGTPRDCAGCHRQGGRAPGKPPSHVPTTTACDSCHFSTSWAPSRFRHRSDQGVGVASCGNCHNGSTAPGKNANHVPTAAACDSCHKTSAWIPAGYTHAQVVPGTCASCHNGVRASGKSARHIPSSASCDKCHGTGAAFTPASVGGATMHANMAGPAAAGNCSTCHNGNYVAQNAQAKSATHFPTSEQCDTCHLTTTSWGSANFDHAAVSPPVTGICSSCHGSSALGKSSSHVPTSQQCDVCHSSGFVAFKPAQMNHFAVAGQCAGCHSGAYAFANAQAKPASHLPTTLSCDSCHVNGFVTWTPAVMNHAGSAGRCITCHSGGFLAQNAQVKPATHVSTTAQCDSCHQSTTTWATRIFNHDLATPAVAGRCASCHNGVGALGKPTTHVPTGAQCDSCHNNFNAFRPSRMNHAGTASQCNSCHNGNYRYANADGRPVGHIPGSGQCDTCHAGGFVNWSPATMNHTGLAGLCSSCHSGTYLAQNAQVKPATHIATTAQCDSCHRSTTTWASATFNHATAVPAVAGRCNACHNSTIALGKPTNHVPTAGQCDSCHTNFTAFAPAAMNHVGTAAQCDSCHNGRFLFANAFAKTPTHIPTTVQCDTCHRSTTTWAGGTFTHPPTAVGSCSICHNGATAVGKTPTHIPTALQCDSCHGNYLAFRPAAMNHAGLAGQCQSCHNGSFVAANAQAKPVSHIPTAVQCDLCHVNGFVAFAPSTMNHAGTSAPVAAGNCATCHSGTYVAQNAQIKPPTHVVTTAQCDSCHRSTTSWATVTFNHATVTPPVAGRCASCHNSAAALGKPTTHMPTTAQCDICHVGFVAFAPAAMNHAATAGPLATGNCSTCHGGAFVSMNARTKPATHLVTAQQCDACHSTTAWKPTSFNHTGVVAGSCLSCHNGTSAQGKLASHLPTNAACDVCHSNFVSFAPATMNHAGTTSPLAAANCSTCHGGAFLAINAQVKPVTHVATTAQCDTCHTSTTTWARASFSHDAAAVGRCANCHNGTTALGRPTTHVPTTTQCDTCHQNFTAFRPALMNHAATSGPVAAGNCSTCHGGTYVAVNALAKPASHIPTTKQCDSCHNRGFVAWVPATMNHTGLAGQCTTCHSGAYVAQRALAKPPTHIATTAQCDSCHNSTTTWATATFNHATASPAVTGRCATCHNGTNALGKPVVHVPTTAQCDVCHKAFTAFSPATMSHAGTLGPVAAANCARCHNGTYLSANALAKPATHLVTTQSCDVCHTTTVWKPTSFSHTGVTPGSCATCHNGVAAVGKPTVHIPTTLACDVCHRAGGGWLPVKPFPHTGIAAGTCATCHSPSYPNMSSKRATHPPTTALCDACHHSFTAWLPTTYNHAGVATNSCQTCHGGTYPNIRAKPANHVPTTTPAGSVGNECSRCHTSTTNFLTGTMQHGTMQTGCRTCHLSTATYQGTMDKRAASHEGMGTRDCSSSGCHRPLGSRGSAYTRWD